MNPALLASDNGLDLIVQGIAAALTAAPQIADVVTKAKDLIAALFSAGAITIEQQNAVHAHVDALCAALLAGDVPPAWQVQPDPQ